MAPPFYRIAKLVLDDDEKNKATSLASEWEALAVSSSGFITSTYGDPSNWILPYHLYSAKLIASDIISEGVSWLNRQMVHTLTSSMIGVHESTKILWDADTPRSADQGTVKPKISLNSFEAGPYGLSYDSHNPQRVRSRTSTLPSAVLATGTYFNKSLRMDDVYRWDDIK